MGKTMTIRIAINGLGRIGRCVVRALVESGRTDIELVAVNGGSAPAQTHVHLLSYDSVHGRFKADVQAEEGALIINGKRIALLQQRDIAKLDWAAYGVDVVLECTGQFTKREAAARHLKQGAKKVLVSAPAEGADATIVYGVNNGALQAGHEVVSVGSCTTNCLAPVAKVLNDLVGIKHGFMTTVHAFTGDQNLVDGSHSDLQRARAATMSMVPSKTGAAKAIGLVLPELAGKLDGVAIRVPTPNVSMVDLTFTAARETTVTEINAALTAASEGALKGVLAVNTLPLVSIDFNGHPASSIADLAGTKVMGGTFVRVASWYDNEWGFSQRMLDVTRLLKPYL
jgi:glyceraldehyde 3-phosphate dehydrogenase